MSTFGKKALIWWDYHTPNYIRYSRTPKEMQLKILKKWYPIGMKCKPKWCYSECEIIDYVENISYWCILLKMDDRSERANPFILIPTPDAEKEIKREIKLKRILGHDD